MMSTDRVYKIISANPLFSVATDENIRLLSEMVITESYVKDEYVFKKGDSANDFYIVANGSVTISHPETGKKIRNININDGFGEYGLLKSNKRTADAVANEDIVLLSIDYIRFKEYLMRSPEAIFSILKTTVDRLTRLENKVN